MVKSIEQKIKEDQQAFDIAFILAMACAFAYVFEKWATDFR